MSWLEDASVPNIFVVQTKANRYCHHGASSLPLSPNRLLFTSTTRPLFLDKTIAFVIEEIIHVEISDSSSHKTRRPHFSPRPWRFTSRVVQFGAIASETASSIS